MKFFLGIIIVFFSMNLSAQDRRFEELLKYYNATGTGDLAEQAVGNLLNNPNGINRIVDLLSTPNGLNPRDAYANSVSSISRFVMAARQGDRDGSKLGIYISNLKRHGEAIRKGALLGANNASGYDAIDNFTKNIEKVVQKAITGR